MTTPHPSPGRRLVLGLAGALPALAALGACTPGTGPGGGTRTSPGPAAPAACHEGATVPRRTITPTQEPAGSEIMIDESVLTPSGIAVSPDGTLVAANAGAGRARLGLSATAGTVLWSTADGTVAARLDNVLSGAIAWHPDGSLLAIGGPEHIELTAPDGEVLWTLTGHGPARKDHSHHSIHDLAFSEDGSMLASLSPDGTVRLWSGIGTSCAPGEVLDVHTLRALSLSLSPDGTTLAVCGTEAPVELWDIASAERRAVVEGTEFAPRAVAYAADGTLLIGTGVPAVHTVDSPEEARLYTLRPGGEPEPAPTPLGLDAGVIAVSSSGDRVAVVGTHDIRVMIWDRSTGERQDLRRTAGSPGPLAWSPEADVLYGASPVEGLVAWDGTDWTVFELP